MPKTDIITGLDVGTNTIKVLVVQKKGKDLNVLCYSEVPSFGLRKGAVIDIDQTAKNIQILLSNVEKECGKKISSVFVNIGGSHLYVTPSDGIISVSRTDQIISQEDIDRVLQATKAINIPLNEDVYEAFPREFIVDDQKGIKHPLGLKGIRLEAKTLLLCYFQYYFVNLTQAVLNTKVQIDDVIPSPLAAANAVITPQQKELGIALVDIGASTTSLAVFEEGDLIHLAVFPIGSANITNDIAIGLRTEVSTAEEIKKQHGTCMLSKNDAVLHSVQDKDLPAQAGKKNVLIGKRQLSGKKKIEIADGTSQVFFTKKQIVDIVEPRVSEILDLVQKELKKIGRQELLPGGVVFTGGGSKIPKLKELAKEQLRLPCRIAFPKDIPGLPEDPALATVAGLAKEGFEVDSWNRDGILKGWRSKIRRMLRLFIP